MRSYYTLAVGLFVLAGAACVQYPDNPPKDEPTATPETASSASEGAARASEDAADKTAAAAAPSAGPAVDSMDFVKPGFRTFVRDGRLWAFREGSHELEEFESRGDLEKHVTLVGAGPRGMTVKGPDRETILGYLAEKQGFAVRVVDGRIWVFRRGADAVAEFDRGEVPEKHVTRIGAGPLGTTIKGLDSDTIAAYVVAQPGFETFIDPDGRLWVFRLGSRELDAYRTSGLPEKHITLVGRGPLGLTLKAPDRATADAYLASVPR